MDLCMFYHGTSETSAHEIRKYGVDVDRKSKSGCAVKIAGGYGLNDKSSKKYNYLSKSIEHAAKYAKMHSHPEIVRVIYLLDRVKSDPEDPDVCAVRTKDRISRLFVMPKSSRDLTDKKIKRMANKFFKKKGGIDRSSQRSAVRKRLREIAHWNERNDLELLRRTISPIDEEKERDEHTLKVIERTGVDISQLKEGMEFSVVIEDE